MAKALIENIEEGLRRYGTFVSRDQWHFKLSAEGSLKILQNLKFPPEMIQKTDSLQKKLTSLN